MVTSYEGTKIRQVINKGTKVIETEMKKPNWAGEDFHDHQTEKIHLAGNVLTSSAKGTAKVSLNTINRKRPHSPKGRIISIRRGTALQKLG